MSRKANRQMTPVVQSAPAFTESALPPRVMELLTMLTYKRPARTETETRFIDHYIVPTGATRDAHGNYRLTIGESPILWSSHTDTVHLTEGKQRVLYGHGIATTDSGECLGADCTTGVWIMLQMIRAGIPGTYLFHRDEECGGKGSAWIAKENPEWLAGIRFAIAFDRKGFADVITHQGGKTASDKFAESLAKALPGLELKPCDLGIFTDTANYSDIVPECTNISVGYMKAHSAAEMQDVAFACRLVDSILKADFAQLVESREPGDSGYSYSRWSSDDTPARFADWELEDYVYSKPGVVADFLHLYGFRLDDLVRFAAPRRAGKAKNATRDEWWAREPEDSVPFPADRDERFFDPYEDTETHGA
jgi:hypothetical protein